ncbi:N/A [soil metagenome]
MTDRPRVLLTGATGFVGEHIHPALVAAGFDVLCGTRRSADAAKNDPSRRYCHFDLGDDASVKAALARVDRAVYLAHSMAESTDYDVVEQADAERFRDAAAACGIERIVYLGGMKPRGKPSRHLESRLRTGEILRSGTVPTIEIRATMILGGGSESFRIVRDLAARLPWMLLPRWLQRESEPVAVADIAAAIVHALEMPVETSSVFDAPGPERISGKDILFRIASLLGQKPKVVDVPFVTPMLSSYWIRLVTRANPRVATELVEGLRSDIVSSGTTIWSTMPSYVRTPLDEALELALGEEKAGLSSGSRMMERFLHRLARA